ncbi:hypothetical protein [Nonomuraea sp. NPDC003709]|uniref:hypothetical protein n=1 Tax=Nonomuraea sp. NPDC003709 TaxID=3154450 RepID=UPI0033AED185
MSSSIAVQLACEAGARVIGTGRAGDRDTALDLGADAFLDLRARRWHARLNRLAPTVRPRDGQTIFFVVEPDRARPADLARRVRDGRLRPIVGAVRTLAEVPSAFAATQRDRPRSSSRRGPRAARPAPEQTIAKA